MLIERDRTPKGLNGQARSDWLWVGVTGLPIQTFERATPPMVRLNHKFPGEKVMLGPFRLSFTNDAATLQTTRILLDQKDSELIDLAELIKQAQEKPD